MSKISEIGISGETWASNTLDPPELKQMFRSSALKIFHNIFFDLPRLKADGWILNPPFWDTMLAQHVIEPDAPGYSLNATASYWLDMHRWKHEPGPPPKRKKDKTWKRHFTCKECDEISFVGIGVGLDRTCTICMDKLHTRAMEQWKIDHKEYNRIDSAVLVPIQKQQAQILRNTGQYDLFTHMMDVVVNVLIPLQERGVKVNQACCRNHLVWFTKRERLAVERVQSLTSPNFNPYSSKQVHELLYKTWNIPPIRHRGTNHVTADEEALRTIAASNEHSARKKKTIFAILRARTARKFRETYLTTGPRIQPRYSTGNKDNSKGSRGETQIIAATGRILAKGDKLTGTPPIQQYPKRVRDTIIPESGECFVQADYQSQELWIQAALSKEIKLLELLKEGKNLHRENELKFNIPRVKAKNMWYGGVAYGGGWKAVQSALRAKGYFVSKKDIESFREKAISEYPRLFEYNDGLISHAKKHGYIINPFGRRRAIYDCGSLHNEIINWPIQSTGADIMWRELVKVDKLAKDFGGTLRLIIHDSFVCSIPSKWANQFSFNLKLNLEQPIPELGISIPVDIKIGKNWKEVS